MRFRNSISFMLSLVLTSIMVSVSCLLILYYYLDTKGENTKELEDRADEYIEVLSSGLTIPIWNYDRHTVESMGKAFALNELVVSLTISDGNHERLFFLNKQHDGRFIYRSKDLYYKGIFAGNISIVLTSSVLDKLNQQLMVRFIIAMFLVIVFVAFTTNIALRVFIGRPLITLNTLAESYGAGDYSFHPMGKTYQEFQSFSNTMREMGAKIVEQMNTIRKAEGRYKAIFNHASEGIFQISEDWEEIHINPAMAQIVGVSSPEEALEKIFGGDLRGAATKEGFSQVVSRIKEEGAITSQEYLIHCFGGGKRWLLLSGRTTVSEDDGRVYYEGTAFDITPRKQALRDLESLKAYLNSVVDSMPSILVAVDIEANVTLWNNQAEVATGIDRDNALGRPISELFADFTTELESFDAAILENRSKHFAKLERFKNGAIHFFDLLIYPLDLKERSGAVVRMDDVTERVKIEKIMVQTEKIASVGGLAAGMAHEINNPLGVVIMGVQNLERRLSAEGEANWRVAKEVGLDLDKLQPYMEKRNIKRLMENMKKSVTRASEIISNMLHFSRQSESKMAPNDLSRICESAIQLANTDYDLKKKYDFRQIEITREYDPNLGLVPCTETEIEQVILNLLKNAAQAIIQTAMERKPVISIRVLKKENIAQLEVEDNGPGMDEEIRRRVFEPFFTTKPVGSGTGLGLSVSYMIITQNHHGEFDVETTPGQGTRFIIRIPASRNV